MSESGSNACSVYSNCIFFFLPFSLHCNFLLKADVICWCSGKWALNGMAVECGEEEKCSLIL